MNLAALNPVANGAVRTAVIVAVLTVHAGLLGYSAWIHSPVWDEMGHLPAGLAHWKSGSFDLYRVNPPLVRTCALAIPFLLDLRPDETGERYYSDPHERMEFPSGSEWLRTSPETFLEALRIARWTCIGFSLVGALASYHLAAALFGVRSALVALVLWCTSPMILGHGALITPDVGSAAFAAVSMLAVVRWTDRATWLAAALVGLALGTALLSKFTNLFLLPAVALSAGASLVAANPDRRAQFRILGQFAVMGVVALNVINAGYLFENVGVPLGEIPFVSRMFRAGAGEGGLSSNRLAETPLARFPCPIPANYVLGIDVQRRDFESGMLSYLRGEWRDRGWWHYYAYAFAVKEPTGTLVLLAMALCGIWRLPAGMRGRLLRFAVVPAGLFVIGVSSQTGFNHHLRYLLPAYPFLYVIASVPFASINSVQRRLPHCVALLCLAATVVGSLKEFPHSMSYFNALAGGPMNGPRHLHNSNLDWGQDLLLLSRWADDHPECRPLRVVFSGGYSSQDLPVWGQDVVHEELTDQEMRRLRSGQPPPVWYAISAGRLYDPPLSDSRYRYFRERKPDECAGYSIYIFRTGDGTAP